jgi:hypothetical protein
LHLFLNLILPSQILHFVQQFYSYISLCNNWGGQSGSSETHGLWYQHVPRR